jgi:hypothetical protein
MCLTPRQALEDPHLGFNLSVMRAADQARITDVNLALSKAMGRDKSGMAAIMVLIAAVFEDQ